MTYLFIDTSSENLIISIVKNMEMIYCFFEENITQSSSKIMPVLDEGFKKTNLKPNDIDKIFIVNGPGSFTGIRVGLTPAKVMSWALNIPLIPISELELLSTISNNNIIVPIESNEEEIVSYLYSFYQKHEVPKEIVIPTDIEENLLSKLLDTSFVKPLKGTKKKLLEIAYENAKITLENSLDRFKNDEKRVFEAHDNLRKILNMNSLYRIDAFDNSNLFGSFSVGAMVVFKNGKPSKNDYRKYKISVDKNDDYHMMKEVIYRRYFRCIVDKEEMPDLIILDGGLNQINACKEVLNTLNLNIKVVGLKKDNHHRTNALLDSDTLKTYDLTGHDDVFNYLTRIQDEVHRFVITYHKTIRSKGMLKSMLSNVEGLGTQRINNLLKKFGSIEKIKNADIQQLKKVIPENI